MPTPSNLSFGYFIFELVIGFFIAVVGFLYGLSATKTYMRRKEWDDSLDSIIIVNIIWFFLLVFIDFIVLYFIGPTFTVSLITDIIRVAVGIVMASVIVALFYNKKFSESFIFAITYQVIIYALTSLLGAFVGIVKIMLTGGQKMFESGLTFCLMCLILLGVNVFYINWGDKSQFVRNKNLVVLLAFIPSFFYLVYRLDLAGKLFTMDFFINLVWALGIMLLTSTVLKIAVQSRLSLEGYREISVLEEDKQLLIIKDLKVYYPLIGGMLKRQFGSVKAVDGISFDITTGETVGLVGESGCGKTTVANAILGLVPREAGQILFNGEPIPADYTKHLRQKIQIVYQDPDASLNPRMKVVDIIAEPLKNLLGITKKDTIRRRVLELLNEVSLEREHMDRFPHEFSGGQKQRIIIARALASNPELVILDEPTSALDVSVQAQILNLLKKLQKTYNYGFLFITHNLAVVNHIADRVAVMYLGKFVEVGETNQIFMNPTHPYTQALLASRTELDPKNKEISFVIKGEVPSPIAPPPGCTFNPRCISDAKTKECMRETPHLIEIEEGHYIWCVNPPLSMQKQSTILAKSSDMEALDN
ncbi:MAG: ABC transporter ATP-binding protein [Promethearchaeota archaeon]|jgi:oligopeptide/dipeptide ABC transporter ATP-binding protein